MAYKYVTKQEISRLVEYAVSDGKMSPIADSEIQSLTDTINRTMAQRNLIERIPYGRDNYKDIVDEIFVALTE